MKKDLIFFGDNGLTSTSANYCANIAKEMYRAIEEELNSVVFYTTEIGLIGQDKSLLKEGVKDTSVFEQKLKDIAQLKSLIAWLREAIKAKENLFAEATHSSYEDYGFELPTLPEREKYITEDDIVATWNIKQRNRYYHLETLCATIGAYIHPDGVFARERKELHRILHEPREVIGNGRDAVIYTRTPSIATESVEDTFMQLQVVYRGYQAELNSLKHSIESAYNEDRAAKDLKYEREFKEYQNAVSLIDAQVEKKKHEGTTAVQNLKIVIPDSLKPIYDKVQEIGKK